MQCCSTRFKGEGRWGGGITYQDTPQVHPCRLGLGFLPRTVLVSNPPTPASIAP